MRVTRWCLVRVGMVSANGALIPKASASTSTSESSHFCCTLCSREMNCKAVLRSTKRGSPVTNAYLSSDDDASSSSGEAYATFVSNKRARNQQKLKELGLLSQVFDLRASENNAKLARSRQSTELRLLKKLAKPLTERRASGRLKGETVDDGFFVVSDSGKGGIVTSQVSLPPPGEQVEGTYGGRVNDGEPLDVYHQLPSIVEHSDREEERADISNTLAALKISRPASSSVSGQAVGKFQEFWKGAEAEDSKRSQVSVSKPRAQGPSVERRGVPVETF